MFAKLSAYSAVSNIVYSDVQNVVGRKRNGKRKKSYEAQSTRVKENCTIKEHTR